MKPRWIVLLAGLTVFCLAAGAQEVTPAHAPKIVCDQPSYSFGDADNTKDVEHTFVLKNTGDLSLEIKQVRPSCGCTVASISQNTIPPNQEAQVTAKLSLHGRQGPQHKTITVESTDPKQPSLILTLEGNAIAELQLRPSQLFFGRITSDSTVTGAVDLAIQSTNPVAITKSSVDSPYLTVTNHLAADGKAYRVIVATRPPLPKGTLRANAHLETNHPKYPTLDIAVSAFVVGDLTFAPEEIALVQQNNQPATRYIILRSETGKPFKIDKVEPPATNIMVNVSPMDATGYRIELKDIPIEPSLNGKLLRITTTMEGTKEILIPFRVITTAPAMPPAQTPQPTHLPSK